MKKMMNQEKVLVTGAAGFIGSSFLRLLRASDYEVVAYDALTYAGHLQNIEEILGPKCTFVKGDLCDFDLLSKVIAEHQFSGIFNFAAESHVDNSISGPKAFIETNVVGTFNLLEAARQYFESLTPEGKKGFRFLHVSTDEVFGSLDAVGKFSETSPYAPNSPYSASKACSDHLVRAWFHTYNLPTIVTNCSNNYGPRQFPEKLIPRMILYAISNQDLPVYGSGQNIRDWIHVEDHCAGVLLAFENGNVGESYCFGGNSERTNLSVTQEICRILDEKRPSNTGKHYESQIRFVEDRKGHDFRYAIDDSYAKKSLGYERKFQSFELGLRQTVEWYLNNSTWVSSVSSKERIS